MSNTTLPTRGTDPDTSVAAAQQASGRAPIVREVVLDLVKEHGPLTHDELIAAYHMLVIMDPDTPRASESGIRTRLSELKRAKLVAQDTKEGTSAFGNRAKRWLAVDPNAPRPVASAAPADPDDTSASPAFDSEDIVGFTTTGPVSSAPSASSDTTDEN